jgi:hypothetical protein
MTTVKIYQHEDSFTVDLIEDEEVIYSEKFSQEETVENLCSVFEKLGVVCEYENHF